MKTKINNLERLKKEVLKQRKIAIGDDFLFIYYDFKTKSYIAAKYDNFNTKLLSKFFSGVYMSVKSTRKQLEKRINLLIKLENEILTKLF